MLHKNSLRISGAIFFVYIVEVPVIYLTEASVSSRNYIVKNSDTMPMHKK